MPINLPHPENKSLCTLVINIFSFEAFFLSALSYYTRPRAGKIIFLIALELPYSLKKRNIR